MPRFTLTVATAFLTVLASSIAFAQAPPTVVRVAPAELREVQNRHRVTGSLRAVARGDVAALEEGQIIEITVREGAAVRRGDVIARIDARRLDAQREELTALLRATEAQVKQRKLELRQTQRDLKRSQKLVGSRAISLEEHQHRETDAALAEAQLVTDQRRVAEVESQLKLLDVRLADVVVRAPYDGRVVERHAEPGEWIHPGEPFITLVSSGQIEAWLDVPERYAQTLGGEQVRVEAQGFEKSLSPVSVKRVPDVHSRTRTFPLVLTLDDQEGKLSPGMSVDAWLPVGQRERRLTVPKDAVIRNGRTAYVYKAVEEDGRTVAVSSPVEVAFETGELVALAGGEIAAGDRVIVEGNERLMPGAEIAVATPAAEERGENRYATAGR